MRALIILTLFAAFLTSCSGGKKKGVDPSTGLTKEEYATVKAINDSFGDLEAAIDIGTKPSLRAAPSEKATNLAKLIPEGSCSVAGPKRPIIDVSRNWVVTRTVDGVGCPLKISHSWEYSGDSQSRKLLVKERFAALSKEFQNESYLKSYEIPNGEYTVINKTAVQTVDGDLNYVSFQVEGVGLITAGVKTKQQYGAGRKGGGNLIFQLYGRNKLRITVKISWYTGRADVYMVNGTTVGLGAIEDLFSGFGLMEIKARSLNLLY